LEITELSNNIIYIEFWLYLMSLVIIADTGEKDSDERKKL